MVGTTNNHGDTGIIRRRARTNDIVSKSRIGVRKYAPEHFAFDCAKNELVVERAIIWTYRRIIIAGSLAFVSMGALSVFFLPKDKWLFPIDNNRTLLCLHFFFATPFLFGTLWQRLTVPKMAEAGRQTDVGPAVIRNKHKIIGRITFVCSFGASTTALALSPRALAGGPIFAIWSIFWLFVTFLAWRAARQKRYTAHKMWAETLSRTALAFVFGRLSLVAYSNILWALANSSTSLADHEEHIRNIISAYYIAVVVTWSMILYLTVDLHRKSEHAEKKALAKMRIRQIQKRFALITKLKAATKGDDE